MKKRSLIILSILIVIFFIGVSIAYFSTSLNIENNFITSKFATTISENFISPSNWHSSETIDKTFYVSNIGDNDIAVRLSYSEEWKDKGGNVLSNVQNDENIAIINLSNNGNWIKDGDYYFYRYALKPNDTTLTFLDSVTFNSNIEYFINCINDINKLVCKYGIGDYENATYKLTFYVDTVQYNMYKDVWNTSFEIINN